MQQPEYFGKKKDEERDARLERLDQKFSENVAIAQGLNGRISKIEKDQESFKESIENIKKLHQSVNETLNYLSANIFTNIDDFRGRINSLDSNLLSMNAKIDSHSGEYKKNNSFIIDNVNSIQSQVKSLNIDEKISSQKKYMTAVTDEIRNQIHGLENKIKDLDYGIKDIISKIIGLSFGLSKTDQKLLEYFNSSEKYASSLNSFKDEINRKVLDLYNELKTEITKFNVKHQQQKIDESHIVDSVKESMKKDIDFITVDSQNASLKYNSVSTDISLLSKKLENVQLMLKKLEQSKLT